MADFHSTDKEELCIDGVRKEGFGYSESLGFSEGEFPKYFVIRVALARALQLPRIPLESPQWDDKKLGGEKGKEYHLEQLTGKDSKNKDDFDVLTRALLYIKHKEELDRDNIDIFSDEKKYTDILGKYIRRGLYELRHSWKNNDCFYQWCLDNLNLHSAQNATNEAKSTNISSDNSHFTHLQKYFRQFAINIQLVNETDSYRYHICKIELEDSDKISAFKTKAKYLDDEFGFPVLVESCEGMQRAYNIQIAKPESQWQNLGLVEFKEGLAKLKMRDFKLGIYAGNEVDKSPFCFDLADAPHCFVAGTTNSGKTKFIQTMIVCLAQNPNTQIIVLDPKGGIDFRVFGSKINLIVDMQEAGDVIENLIDEMNERNAKMSETGVSNIQDLGLKFRVLIIDELNNLVENNKGIKDRIARLAEMARQAGIHLVLGTQRPDGKLLMGLRNNIDGKIALRVGKETESKIILDEVGAEKLLGKGDMLIKMGNMPRRKHIFSCFLQNDEIKSLI
ncbi:FtsK/SpoIIIE domain-containing protein [Helicobacter sp. T3_23-1059]